MNLYRLGACLKCGGDLAYDDGDWACLHCGTYYYTGLYAETPQPDDPLKGALRIASTLFPEGEDFGEQLAAAD